MTRYPTFDRKYSSLDASACFIGCLDIQLSYIACCGIQSWMLRHPSLVFFFHFLPSSYVVASIIAWCGMLFSYFSNAQAFFLVCCCILLSYFHYVVALNSPCHGMLCLYFFLHNFGPFLVLLILMIDLSLTKRNKV